MSRDKDKVSVTSTSPVNRPILQRIKEKLLFGRLKSLKIGSAENNFYVCDYPPRYTKPLT